MRTLLALLVLAVVVLAVAASPGRELAGTWPDAPSGVAMLATQGNSWTAVVLGGFALLMLIGICMVNLNDPESESSVGGGMILLGLVLLFVIFELVF